MNTNHSSDQRLQIIGPIRGNPITIGAGFSALSFREAQFQGLMDPLVMVDHFTMTAPTFGPHPHAGMSAVSMLFEDSEGVFHNRDSLGHDLELQPGDLYWLKAGRGAVHDEAPRPGARIHALQVFVNLPERARREQPDALHVPAAQMPVIEDDGYRLRVMLGESQGVVGPRSPAQPLTVLDLKLREHGSYLHNLPAHHAAWIHAINGDAELHTEQGVVPIPEGQAVALRAGARLVALDLRSHKGAHLAILAGAAIQEPFIQQGPFIMRTPEDLSAAHAAYAAGHFGGVGARPFGSRG